jgi:CubicO group peptidase (beta-lactamase class C family)
LLPVLVGKDSAPPAPPPKPTRRVRSVWVVVGITLVVVLVVLALLVEQLVTGNLRLGARVEPAEHTHDAQQTAAATLATATAAVAVDQVSAAAYVTDALITTAHREATTDLLDNTILPSNSALKADPPLKHAYGLIGNANTHTELVIGRGERSRGVSASARDYLRWGAFSQVPAAVVFMIAVEEGIMGIEDEVRQYLPELDAANLRVLRHDASTGLPNSTEEVKVQITLRHLLTQRSGHTYLFWRLGAYMLPSLFGSSARDEAYIWENYPEQSRKMSPNEIATGACPDYDGFVHALMQTPLVHAPGETPRLGPGYVLAGAMLTAALRQMNHSIPDAAQYMRSRLLDPLHMTDTYLARVEDPPADVGDRLAEAFLLRMGPPDELGDGHLDPAPRNGVPGDYIFGDAYPEAVWTSDVPQDSYYCLVQGSYESAASPSNNTRYGSGGIHTSLTGTLANMGAFIRMIINEGVGDDGARIVSRQSIAYLLNPTTTPTEEELRYFQAGGEFGRVLPEDHSFSLAGGVPLLSNNLPFPIAQTTYTYTTYYGTTLYFDTHTGHYAVLGTSVPANADGLFSSSEKRSRARELFAVAARL